MPKKKGLKKLPKRAMVNSKGAAMKRDHDRFKKEHHLKGQK